MNKIEVLIATMNQTDFSIAKKMNLQTDAIIINQTNRVNSEELNFNGNNIVMHSMNERGIGKSRNNAIMKSNAEICMIADDDMIYIDGYEEKVLNAFIRYPKADILIFEVKSLNPDRPNYTLTKNKKVNYMNFMKYGACRIAFRREAILQANIYFSLLFGGGATFGSGEDTLFIAECLKKGLKIYTCTEHIANVTQEQSSWFNGINEKYYEDKGALIYCLSRRYYRILIIILSLKWYKSYKGKFKLMNIIKLMKNGAEKCKRRL